MSEETNGKKKTTENDNIQFHVPPDLDYAYRDVVNIYVGSGEVVLEFGNYHRSMPGHVSIANRIVMTLASAHELQESLQLALQEAYKQLQQQMDPSCPPQR